jgi:hypothetical protein
MDQPTAAPTDKVAAGAIGGAITVIAVWAVKAFTDVDVPAEVSAAVTAIVSTVLAYLVPERA